MKSIDIRRLRTEFWETKAPGERVHRWTQPASLIVNSAEDPTTMFTTAGMQPLVPYLMGKPHPGGKRVYNIQGCVRTTDIEEVGDERHLTFFEMMGNRSLGDYFKKEAIQRSREFLTTWLHLDPAKLAVTVFEGDDDAPKDEESATYRKEVGMPNSRISYLGKKDNRRGPAGKTGPCGPDTEIFYRVGAEEFPPAGSDVARDEDNWLEIRNNVFMQYYKNDNGTFEELPAKNVDTGMGFERISMVVQHAAGMIQKPLREATVYDTDIFSGIMKILEVHIPEVMRQRVLADHVRTAFWLTYEGLVPSNEGRGYVLRRLIRSMFFQWYQTHSAPVLDVFEEVLYTIKEYLNTIYAGQFTNTSIKIILEEVEQFTETISNGKRLLDEYLQSLQSLGRKILVGSEAFKLYDTYGFPLELTKLLCTEVGIAVDEQGFEQELEQARERSRQGGGKMFSKEVDRASVIDGMPPTQFVGYDSVVLGETKLLKDIIVGGQRILIFDRSPFYATSGGQTGDKGSIELDSGEQLIVKGVEKYGGVRLHFIQ